MSRFPEESKQAEEKSIDEKKRHRLTAEAVESAALALERVDDVERRNGLALGVLGVGDRVTDDALEEGLEDTAGLVVDHW